MAGNLLTNQRPAFDGKSLERDGTLIMSEGHLDEFTVSIWKQCNEDESYTVFSQSYAHLRLLVHPPVLALPEIQIYCNAMGQCI